MRVPRQGWRAGKDAAMATGRLPADGELRIGSVMLPAGRQIHAGYGSGGPVAWATTEPVPDAGRVWAALSRAHPGTGLVPFLLSGLGGDPGRPWDWEEFGDPEDISGLDGLDASAFLQPRWDGFVPSDDEDEEEEVRAALGPFSRTFPGLAPAEDTPLSAQQIDAVLGSLPAARIGLGPGGLRCLHVAVGFQRRGAGFVGGRPGPALPGQPGRWRRRERTAVPGHHPGHQPRP
jgi:hypothetical protein